MKKVFGWELALDFKNCNDKVSNINQLNHFITFLCKEIDMVPYGEPLIQHFGHKSDITSGFSIAQLIETSLISGHFSDKYKTAHLNIFSCKAYDSGKVVKFCKDFFEAELVNIFHTNRMME